MPPIENRWSIGNVLTLVGMAISCVIFLLGLNAAMTRMDEGLANLRATDARHEIEMGAIRADASAREARIRALETAMGRADERLTGIYSTVQRIERLLEGGAGQ